MTHTTVIHIDDWELSARCSKHNHPFAPCPYCQIENKDSLIDKLTALAEQLTAENARLTAALVECQEAFDSGRDVGERAGYGELPF